jgi:hypothetical protein
MESVSNKVEVENGLMFGTGLLTIVSLLEGVVDPKYSSNRDAIEDEAAGEGILLPITLPFNLVLV